GKMPGFNQFRLVDAIAAVTPSVWQGWFAEIWPVLQASELPPLEVFPLANWLASIEAFDLPGRTVKPAIAFSSSLEATAREWQRP
ncbi:hypothetical protein ACQUZK_09550, partial [Streptococcus pyogenes]|uniref:hypothetical protein n=1 Tax=Streptococcus pyogenes TaxID=1314 RepID=UPI003DA1828B